MPSYIHINKPHIASIVILKTDEWSQNANLFCFQNRCIKLCTHTNHPQDNPKEVQPFTDQKVCKEINFSPHIFLPSLLSFSIDAFVTTLSGNPSFPIYKREKELGKTAFPRLQSSSVNKACLHGLSRQLNFQKGPNSINNTTGPEDKAHSWGRNVGTSWGPYIMQLWSKKAFKGFLLLMLFKIFNSSVRVDEFKIISPSEWHLLVSICETFLGCLFLILYSKLMHWHLHQTATPLAQLLLFI